MKKEKKENESDTQAPLLAHAVAATFEDAITATRFGKFNVILILISIPGRWSNLFETTTMSYVFPAAQCDLNLSLSDKGLLNAITYLGMMSSAFIWGYLCDSLGRKKLMVIGFFLDTCFVLVSSLSQSFTLLVVTKFLGGFIINGPFAALTCYLSEFHSSKYRARVQMVLGLVNSSGSICLPFIAGLILPADVEYNVYNYLRLHSWNIFLLVAACPSLIAGCIFLFLPESPKFLMTIGRNDEALSIMRTVYKINTGKPGDTYPIKSLILERKQELADTNGEYKRDSKQALKEGWGQLKPLFIPPLLSNMLLVCGLQMLIMMSLNTLRLWLPQLFQAINDYEYYNNGTSAPLCTMLDVIRPKQNLTAVPEECVVNNNNDQVYTNVMIVSTVTLIGYIIAGSLINVLGKKILLFILCTTAGIGGFSLYFAQSTDATLIISSLYVALGSICVNVILSVVVDFFPTTLRTMTVSLTMMIGRMGAMTGNLIFPYLLKKGCAPPFFSIGIGILSCAFIGIFLPDTDMKALQ
ncbi:synaptic vesicle glycoprotein 2B-like isoform X2 [Coccinella septempunctata]|uniref:synaptic vesicle glycoprotein 2B-like isoform X2 n=1 Tax=Coccinella septempunctata TaxID=41139 RepID=UPI001D08684F|nr:synaptic vesicle glycoprotein 2B-like isoform X2 [Coccinella septempunctata]